MRQLLSVPPQVQRAALSRPSGWAAARSVSAALTSSFHRADDVWRRRFELNDWREAWIVRLQGIGLDDQ
eukprot:15140877-Alexandrium_andersonii.AAC.1